MNTLSIIVTAVGTLIGALSGALLNRSIRNKHENDAKLSEADAISKLHTLYIDTLSKLEDAHKELESNTERFTSEINENRKEIKRLSAVIETQDKKIDKLTALMELICLDAGCKTRVKCDLEGVL